MILRTSLSIASLLLFGALPARADEEPAKAKPRVQLKPAAAVQLKPTAAGQVKPETEADAVKWLALRAAANKKLVEAQQAFAKASKALRDAQAALAKAEGEKEKETATKGIEQAKAEFEKARKLATQRYAEAAKVSAAARPKPTKLGQQLAKAQRDREAVRKELREAQTAVQKAEGEKAKAEAAKRVAALKEKYETSQQLAAKLYAAARSEAAGLQRKQIAESNKKLAEARKQAADARKAMLEAQEEAKKAVGEEAKTAAVKKVAAAKADFDKKQKIAVRLFAQNQQLTAQARPTVRATTARVVRQNDDREDPVERFLLILPNGPLVVEVAMTLNGKPFRMAREQLIDDMLSNADRDGDGIVRWDEALRSARFTLNRFRVPNENLIQRYANMFDQNRDGIADRAEARQFVAQYYQPAFALGAARGGFGAAGVVIRSSSGLRYAGAGQADVRQLLDTDKDGDLSPEEIAAAEERLKSRDADDNDLLLANEINGTPAPNARRVLSNSRQQPSRSRTAVLLGPTATAADVYGALSQEYATGGDVPKESFSLAPKLFASLDKNEDGLLQRNEVLRLNEVEPQVSLTLNLGESKSKGLQIKSIDKTLGEISKSRSNVSIVSEGVKLSFVANLAPSRRVNYATTAKSLIDRMDKNNNGYLEEDEFTGGFARMYQMWDEDEDGKVYPKEIEAAYERQQEPVRSQIRASAANQGNSLFQALDLSGDGRLSLREMRTAHVQIKKFDKNGDKRVSTDEIPITVSVRFERGDANFSPYQTTFRGGARAPAARPKTDAPEWFTRMDRNGDGDVTLKEFLAGEEEFKKLDTNNDGFIEPKEAKAAAEKTK